MAVPASECKLSDSVEAGWFRRHVSNFVGSTGTGSDPVVETTSHKPTANSAVQASKVTSGNATGPNQLDSCPNTQPILTNKKKMEKTYVFKGLCKCDCSSNKLFDLLGLRFALALSKSLL